MKAIWNGTLLAQSDATIVVEGNHYFPLSSLQRDYFKESSHSTVCPWKGTASYYDVVVDGETNAGAAWYYPETKPKADNIRGMVAFWRQVEVSDD